MPRNRLTYAVQSFGICRVIARHLSRNRKDAVLVFELLEDDNGSVSLLDSRLARHTLHLPFYMQKPPQL